jgi:raffinose/stachyose/melibiose transport system permease protein
VHNRRSPWTPWLILSPGLLLISLFLLWPIVQGIWISLHRFDGISTAGGLTFDAYIELWRDPAFHSALGHTTIFAFMVVIGKNVTGLALALLVNRFVKAGTTAQLLLYLPVTLNIVVIGAFWSMALGPEQFGGLLNRALGLVGLHSFARPWLAESGTSLIVVSAIEIWRWAGLHMLIFVAALQAIDESLYDAARMDGANAWNRFIHVTIPALHPIIAASVVLALIGAFVRSFDVVWVLTRAGYGTDVVGTYIYREAFAFGRFDRATAAGLTIAAGLGALFLIAEGARRLRRPGSRQQ